MAVGFGFCSNCGAPLTRTQQKFCSVCGTVLQSAAPAGPVTEQTPQAFTPPPPEPPAAAVPPPWATSAPAAPTPPQAPPPWAVVPAPVVPVKRGTAVNPLMLVGGVVVVVAVLAGLVYATSGSKPGASVVPVPSATRSGAATGSPAVVPTATRAAGTASIVVTPASFGCNDKGDATLAIVLPASTQEDITVTLEVDETSLGDMALADSFDQKADDSWVYSDSQSKTSLCQQVGPGKHVLHVLDPDGVTLAQGSFTITGTAATPTPAPTPTPTAIKTGAIIVLPALFSCSGSVTSVRMTIVLAPSVPEDAEVTMTIDGELIGSDTVGTGFEKQSDGTWLASDSVEVANLCDFGKGAHTIKVLDSNKKVLAQGVFTAEP